MLKLPNVDEILITNVILSVIFYRKKASTRNPAMRAFKRTVLEISKTTVSNYFDSN